MGEKKPCAEERESERDSSQLNLEPTDFVIAYQTSNISSNFCESSVRLQKDKSCLIGA